MREPVRLFQVIACVVGLAACGYPPLPELGDAAPPFLSCMGLPSTCGASGTDSCCNSLAVPSGSYDRSYDVARDASSGDTSSPATVSAFRLDKYEVTVGRFRAFVEAGMGTRMNAPAAGSGAHASITGSGWDVSWNGSLVVDKTALVAAVKCDSTFQTWTDAPAANEHRPMNCVTWYEAMAFCAWDGGYLATEAEWNYAATGGGEQRAYPWSSPAGALTPLDGSHASYKDGTNCEGDGAAGCALADLVAVGSKPLGDGRWGQSDLAGNVFEWTLDWYASYATLCANCANLTMSSTRVFRGGSFYDGATYLRAGYRFNNTPTTRLVFLGVRCARTP
jgi:formylglycine-generating enzyme